MCQQQMIVEENIVSIIQKTQLFSYLQHFTYYNQAPPVNLMLILIKTTISIILLQFYLCVSLPLTCFYCCLMSLLSSLILLSDIRTKKQHVCVHTKWTLDWRYDGHKNTYAHTDTQKHTYMYTSVNPKCIRRVRRFSNMLFFHTFKYCYSWVFFRLFNFLHIAA